jgi:flagellar biosynthesis/type III secretory pathway protein FliH
MSAFRLQTFEPTAAREPKISARDLAEARDAAWREGFLAGQSAATEAWLADQARLTSDFVEAMADAQMTHEAARRHVAAGLAPLLRAICAALTPALAEAGLAAEIAARVERALAAAPEGRPRLRVAPERVQALRGVLAERGLAATVEAAPELLPREAELHWDHGFDRIDLDACAEEIRACVSAHLEDSEGGFHAERRHG